MNASYSAYFLNIFSERKDLYLPVPCIKYQPDLSKIFKHSVFNTV